MAAGGAGGGASGLRGAGLTEGTGTQAQRIQLIFRKDGPARFLSHLDLMATLEYAVRRANLPVSLSEGFNPRPRLSAASPLSLGYVGEAEILEIVLRERVESQKLLERLQVALPEGITLVSAGEQPPATKPAASRLESATYRIELDAPAPDLSRRIGALLSRDSVVVEDERDGKVRTRDVRPLILSLEEIDQRRLRVTLRFDPAGSIRPEQVLGLLGISPDGATFVRERIVLRGS